MKNQGATKKEKEEVAKAEAFIKEAVSAVLTTKAKRDGTGGTTITLEDIVRERDDRGLSWKQVAVNLSLGSPASARSAYTRLTGRAHTDSQPALNRATRGDTAANGKRLKREAVTWEGDEESPMFQDDVVTRITHHDVLVQRTFRGIEVPEEWVHINRIERFAFEGEDEALTVHVFTKHTCECRIADKRDADSGVARAFRLRDIKEVR